MYPHARKCTHGARPNELNEFANTFETYNLRAFYCQDCLRHDHHRSTTQSQFKQLCQQLHTRPLGVVLQAVPEEHQLDGAAYDAQLSSSPVPGRLRNTLGRLRGHLKTAAQKRREHQRVDEQRMIEAVLTSRAIRGRAETNRLIFSVVGSGKDIQMQAQPQSSDKE